MSVSMAKEKDIRKFDMELLRRFAAKIPVPERVILDAAFGTAERVAQMWPQIQEGGPVSSDAKKRVTEHMQAFPLTRQFAL